METTASIVEIVEAEEIPVVEEVEGVTVEPSLGEGERGGRGRGRGRGRGWRRGYRGRRGRGRGRGAAPTEDGHAEAEEGEQAAGASESRAPRAPHHRRWGPPRPRPTHFISLPIGHHAELQKTVSSFTDALLTSDPAIEGLDQSIVVPARRLHITLGVMDLATDTDQSGPTAASDEAEEGAPEQKPTLASAIAHLESLKPEILNLLAGHKLCVELSTIDIMRSGGASRKRANVVWVGPPHDGELGERLKTVAEFINESFKSAGFLLDDHRPLTLHCTLLNTIYRKPRPKNGWRTHFSFNSILASDALRAIALEPDTLLTGGDGSEEGDTAESKGKGRAGAKNEPVHVDLGAWDVDEVQICEMGSHGPEGEYVCVGKIALA
ncbi:hypothetical protein DAEQUDRAFT_726430 [Daedalea quercina L-15889]|uniref:A-kinase anchor protein 7-like phosphoesterase domain-containing protein n=1 Tax=Daedalea quercina L-15889 TaxID=1314783 RepID=A0A165QHP9_9APHY|nr:hypothetical protein DAEQUDRAFT_726430 [Daedalea quercina L-15889]